MLVSILEIPAVLDAELTIRTGVPFMMFVGDKMDPVVTCLSTIVGVGVVEPAGGTGELDPEGDGFTTYVADADAP